ncbi:MAG: hypothetical protein R2881_04140 [Eubacteriales bacterium]
MKEIENDLQRFAVLRSVLYRSGFGRLHSKNDCGILVLQIDTNMRYPPNWFLDNFSQHTPPRSDSPRNGKECI